MDKLHMFLQVLAFFTPYTPSSSLFPCSFLPYYPVLHALKLGKGMLGKRLLLYFVELVIKAKVTACCILDYYIKMAA